MTKKKINFEKISGFFRSLFVSTPSQEARMLTFYKKESTRSVISSLICIVGGIFIGFLVLLILALSSKSIGNSDALKGLAIILGGPFASGQGNVGSIFGQMIFETAPLILTGLSVAIAFKTGLFNIGAAGQYLMGSMGALLVALSITPATTAGCFFVWLLALVVGFAFGVVWGLIPGLFKALLNVNEVIICIMTNWIAANIVSWVFAGSKYINVPGGKAAYLFPTSVTGVVTPKLGLDKLTNGSYMDIGIFVAIGIAIIVYIILNKTTFGYELKACGYNRNAAKYAGMNEKRNIALSMAIAGGLAALGGCLYYLNGSTEFVWETYSKLPENGFNGIPVALLASNNPIGTVFTALFLRYIDKGGFNLSGYTSFNEYVSDLIIAIIIYFSGFSKLIRDFLVKKRKKRAIALLPIEPENAIDEQVENTRKEDESKADVQVDISDIGEEPKADLHTDTEQQTDTSVAIAEKEENK